MLKVLHYSPVMAAFMSLTCRISSIAVKNSLSRPAQILNRSIIPSQSLHARFNAVHVQPGMLTLVPLWPPRQRGSKRASTHMWTVGLLQPVSNVISHSATCQIMPLDYTTCSQASITVLLRSVRTNPNDFYKYVCVCLISISWEKILHS